MTDIDARKMLELEQHGLIESVDGVFVVSAYGAQVLRRILEKEVFEGMEVDAEIFLALCDDLGLPVVV